MKTKSAFAAVAQWAQAQADQIGKQTLLQSRTEDFEKLLVWFNIKRPTDAYITTAVAKQQKRIDGMVPPELRQQYLAAIDTLTADFTKLGVIKLNDREKLLKELKDTVANHP